MRVLFVTSEVCPLAKSGGLADVSSALPIALAKLNIDVRILLPGYPGALAGLKNSRIECRLGPLLGVNDAVLISGQLPNSLVPVWLVDAPSLFRRSGRLYQDDKGQDWDDNALRFSFLAHVATNIARGFLGNWKPDVIHANDWHTGLIPLLLCMENTPRPATVFTVHNLAFQGNFPRDVLPRIGIPDCFFHTDDIEFYGQASFLKAAIHYSDKITTVSPTYAIEALTPEFGCGLDGALRTRATDFSGILNGIDDEIWAPSTDVHLPERYNARDISGKRICKAELQREFALDINPKTPLLGFASRITHQKMADVILDAIPLITELGAQFVLVGEGDAALEAAFEEAGRRYPGKVSIHIGYEESFAHRLHAGADILLAPARFEPCGLAHRYAARYGAIPLVRRTGGLADTVTDAPAAAAGNAIGFVFDGVNLPALSDAIDRALALFKDPLAWRRLQLHGMSQDFGWEASASKYAALYCEALGTPYSPFEKSSLPIADREPGVQAVY